MESSMVAVGSAPTGEIVTIKVLKVLEVSGKFQTESL